MRKKAVVFISLVLILGVAYSLFYTNQYSIEPEEKAIYASLTDWQSRGEPAEFELRIIEITQLDQTNTHIVLFETPDKQIGYAQLLKGWNGKYKITNSGWGDNLVSYADIKTNDGTYGVLVGKNPGLEINHVVAELENREFHFLATVPDAETFVRYKKLPSELKETFPADIQFYDKSGEIMNPLREER